MRIQRTFLVLTAFACTLAFSSCKVKQTEEGEAPKVDVDPGKAPKVEVEGPDVDVNQDTTVVVTPDVDVKTPK